MDNALGAPRSGGTSGGVRAAGVQRPVKRASEELVEGSRT